MRGLQAGAATLTVLFTDLVSSTELRSRLGDERADRLRREHDDIVAIAVSRNGGTVIKGLGDGMMAAFPAPSGAIAAAVAIQQAIDGRNRNAPVPLALRVGLSAGEVRIEAADVFGTAVVEASRLCGAAESHQILMADVVRVLAGSRSTASCRPVGSLTLKGLTEPVPTVEVEWWATGGAARPVPFPEIATYDRWLHPVGRRLEQVAASQALLAALGGRAGLLVVRGPAGSGKTRLAAELARRAHKDGLLVLYGRADGSARPHPPIVDAVAPLLAALTPDRAADGLGARHGVLTRLLPELVGHVEADPAGEVGLGLGDALGEWLALLAAPSGAILVLDDLHLARVETVRLIEALLTRAGDARLLVVAVAQLDADGGGSDVLSPLVAGARAAGAGVEELFLAPLDEPAVAELLAQLGLAPAPETDELARLLWQSSGGNPLYLVEQLQLLRGAGWLVPTDATSSVSGRHALTLVGRVPADAVPVGIEALRARLSGLDPGARAVLRAAAAAGLEIDLDLLAHATSADTGTVLGVLERTDAAGLTVRSADGRRRRSFAHDAHRWLLDRDAGTETVGVHARLAGAWEERLALGDESAVVPLAHHRTSSGAADLDTFRIVARAGEWCEGHLAPGAAAVWWGHAVHMAAWLAGRDGVPDPAELAARRDACAVAGGEPPPG